jgi:SEFIR domain/Effector-associated domain 8
MNLKPKKVFISYSHDSLLHKDRVLELADHLREDGIDCNIDQYEMAPPKGWPHWMLDEIEAADFVLVVCTEQYDRRFRANEAYGRGKGATWEGGVIMQELYDAQGKNSKFVPVVFTPAALNFIPSPLRGVANYRLQDDDGYELLYCRLTNQHLTPKRDLGKSRTVRPRERKQSFSDQKADANKMSQDKQQPFPSRLIDALLKIPSFQAQENRNMLLQNLPPSPVSTITRSNAPMVDIHNIVYAASAWGRLESGRLALAILLENALLSATGTQLGQVLNDLLAELGDEI